MEHITSVGCLDLFTYHILAQASRDFLSIGVDKCYRKIRQHVMLQGIVLYKAVFVARRTKSRGKVSRQLGQGTRLPIS